MGTDKLTIEHKDVRMNLYKIKKYDNVRIRCRHIDINLHGNMWIGYDCRYMEYVICAANSSEEIQHNGSGIVSNNIVLTFTNEDDRLNSSLNLCCNSDQSAITFDQKELRWKICISAVQPEFVKCALRELFDDAHSAWLNSNMLKITAKSTYGFGFHDYHIGLPEIKDVIFNPPATIVFWEDGTKTVVKAKGECFYREKGLAMAITKKALGNNGRYYEIFKKWIKEDD